MCVGKVKCAFVENKGEVQDAKVNKEKQNEARARRNQEGKGRGEDTLTKGEKTSETCLE